MPQLAGCCRTRIAWTVRTTKTTSAAAAITRQVVHGTPRTKASLTSVPFDPATPSSAANPNSRLNRIMVRTGGASRSQKVSSISSRGRYLAIQPPQSGNVFQVFRSPSPASRAPGVPCPIGHPPDADLSHSPTSPPTFAPSGAAVPSRPFRRVGEWRVSTESGVGWSGNGYLQEAGMRFAIKTRPEHTTWQQLRDVWIAADDFEIFESALALGPLLSAQRRHGRPEPRGLDDAGRAGAGDPADPGRLPGDRDDLPASRRPGEHGRDHRHHLQRPARARHRRRLERDGDRRVRHRAVRR